MQSECSKVDLANVVAAGVNGIFLSEDVYKPLLEAGYVEINASIVNELGQVATRATASGLEVLSSMEELEVLSSMEEHVKQVKNVKIKKGKKMFEIQKRSDVTVIKKPRGRVSSQYPFEKMEVGDCFFVANTEDRPNAAKSLASTVSGVNARYSEPSADGATRTTKTGKVVPVMVKSREYVVEHGIKEGQQGAFVTRQA